MSLLMKRPRVMKSPTLLVPLERWLFLQGRSYFERTGKQFSNKAIERLTRNFYELAYKDKKQLKNDDLGGCKGNPENSWEEG